MQHVWLLFVIFTCANGAISWQRAKKQIAENPDLEPGYRRLIRSGLIYGNLPWLVMGAGFLFGSISSVGQSFSLRNGPFVIAFHLTLVALWIDAFRWIFFRGGAEDLVKHPGILNHPVKDPRVVKGVFLLGLAGGVLALAVIVFNDISAPR